MLSETLYICKKLNPLTRILLSISICCLLLSSCQTVDLYEKTASIPGHQWKSSFKPVFTFTINDTTAAYKLFLTIRHFDKYNYKNIYLKVTTRQPGDDSTRSVMYDLPLANDDEGWKGSGMDDIWEQRILLSSPAGNEFHRKGNYTFTIEQVMREDPLENVLNVGLRIEKK